ncbi:MAG: hypothetical protein ABSC95_22070, partial [Acetobacteraceae bacterium]
MPQILSADGALTARENLLLSARLYRVAPREVRPRIKHALAAMELTPFADHLVRGFSGGMIRRVAAPVGSDWPQTSPSLLPASPCALALQQGCAGAWVLDGRCGRQWPSGLFAARACQLRPPGAQNLDREWEHDGRGPLVRDVEQGR